MKRRSCLLAFLATLSATGLAQRDLTAEFRSTPIWPEDDVIPAELNGRYVYLDPDAGQMVLVYPSHLARDDVGQSVGDYRIERFDLTDQVDASFSFGVRRRGPHYFYTYEIANSAQARHAIRSIRMPTPAFGHDDSIAGPTRWNVRTDRIRTIAVRYVNAMRLAIGRPTGFFLVWSTSYPRSAADPDASAILPSGTMEGFRVTSRLKPGFTLAYVQGAYSPRLRGAMPEAVLDQTDPLMQLEFSSQNVVMIGPRFAAETPKLEIAEDFHRGIDRMVAAGQLRDDSPAIRQALNVLEQCLGTAEETLDGSPTACDLDFAIDANPEPGVETHVLDAMRLSLGE